MSISTQYDPTKVEDKWYQYWMEHHFFHATPQEGKEAYTIVIPPPNVTGVLHMGHMLNNTIQDILIRKARMEGKEACWVPGTDHASIATEAKVVKMLREQGIKKRDLSREEFLKHAWKWKEKYGGIILQQLRKLGASCDWSRTAFTMDESYHRAVIRQFVDLYKKGYIYRGLHMVNWDCEAMTTISNEEVIYNEDGEKAVLYHLKYRIKDSAEFVTIATQRPETIMGDTAIAINPNDKRLRHRIGKKALVPFINREIPVIGDDYVDTDFGTGCLKVTPAHDPNDYEIGLRHNLRIIDTINPDGTLNDKCEIEKYIGKDRFKVRKMIVKDLKAAEILIKEEEVITRIGRSERTNSVVEPKLSLQWFIRMKEISRRAHQAVMDDEIRLFPSKFKNTYNHWMEKVRDWNISRQLWWGQQIPAYYYGEGENDFVVAETQELAVEEAKKATGNHDLTAADLKQDEDVLDTWASSNLWPIAIFDGFNDDCFDPEKGKIDKSKNEDLNFFYPSRTLVTAPEILFFWVARMIIAGYEYLDEKPFENVYLTGIVRDKQRRKMSKSLGNSPDPLDLIRQYGADGVRTGMLFSSPAGNDLLFDEKLAEQGRNFSNKIWNAFRLIKGWKTTGDAQPDINREAVEWFTNKFNKALTELEDHFSGFRISDALMTVYKLIRDDFCSWYLEWIKPEYGKPIDRATYDSTVELFEQVLKVLHPFMPFITEEIWHELKKRDEKEAIVVAAWPKAGAIDNEIIKKADLRFEITSNIRNIRNNKGISQKETLELITTSGAMDVMSVMDSSTNILANVSAKSNAEKPSNAFSFMVGSAEFFIPVPERIDLEAERRKLEEELNYAKGFKTSVEKKLSNKQFVNNAPEQVVETEHKKLADAEAKIRTLEERLSEF
ncbi:MAG: valine--tRNA ligase [Ekhidna sp.]|nr:valine--tRNA ligase [Ekhidna sp.]